MRKIFRMLWLAVKYREIAWLYEVGRTFRRAFKRLRRQLRGLPVCDYEKLQREAERIAAEHWHRVVHPGVPVAPQRPYDPKALWRELCADARSRNPNV